MRKKSLQIGMILILIGMLHTPANSGLDVLSTPIGVEVGGTPLWTFTTSYSIFSVAVGDFNTDGVDDALAGNYAINGATGTALWTSPVEFVRAAVGDFNGDGVDDAISGGGNYVYAVNGHTGTLLWTNTEPTWTIESVAVGDVNGDGVDDALAGGFDTNVYAINGLTGVKLWNFTTPNVVQSLAAGDFNSDGVVDVLAAASGNHVYAINGYTGEELWTSSVPMTAAGVVAIADLNSDGVLDALVGDSIPRVHALNGITGEELWAYNPIWGFVSSIAVGDVTGDGVPDVFAGTAASTIHTLNGTTGEVLWTFTTPMDPESWYEIRSMAVGDFNSDGMPDILIGGDDTNIYAIDGATGDLLWTYAAPMNRIYSVAVGDFNNDGADDALAGGLDQNVYAVAGVPAPPMTKLEVRFTVSKTYVNVTDDWTLARAVVTNVGSFPASGVQVICHAPDGTDHVRSYETILPSHSETATWNLTSGNGLPMVKNPSSAIEISYTTSVEVRATNCPTELAEVPIIVDPPLGSPNAPFVPEKFEILWIPMSSGAAVLIWIQKRRRAAKGKG